MDAALGEVVSDAVLPQGLEPLELELFDLHDRVLLLAVLDRPT